MNKTKIVSQYEEGKLIARYASIKTAATVVGAQPAHIGKVAAGKRNTAAGYGWKYTTKLSDRLTKARKGVSQLDSDGNVVAIYESANLAASLTGIKLDRINKVLAGTSRSAGGYTWVA